MGRAWRRSRRSAAAGRVTVRRPAHDLAPAGTLGKPAGARRSRMRRFVCAIYGNFSGAKAQELVVSRGKSLELLRPNESGRLQTIVATEVFGCIRSLAPFRMVGAPTDYVVAGSDSGRIVILRFNPDRNAFVKVHQETFGRSGCRRIVPGQFISCDPKGRACMIAGVEKQKFVYVLNRDNAANLTISSPLEAHKSHTLCFSIVGMDMGFDNPCFAAIELDYADVDQVRHACMHALMHVCMHACKRAWGNVLAGVHA
eukprot:353171-Chlamydomonas_euryale.AAC.2